MSEPVYFKVSCADCDGHIAYPESSAGMTVACPHCSKDVFLPSQAVIAEPPRFVIEPQNARISDGGYVRFTAKAEGCPSPTYQWFSIGSDQTGRPLPGETKPDLVIITAPVGTTQYLVTATNSEAAIQSRIATLTVEQKIKLATVAQTALWNPYVAARWCWLFGPIFGTIIHARNADTLGRVAEAKTNRAWLYFIIALYVIVIVLLVSVSTFSGDDVYKPEDLRGIWLFVLFISFGWYSHIGKKQVDFVKNDLANNYQKKSWLTPLTIAFGILLILNLPSMYDNFMAARRVSLENARQAQSQQPQANQQRTPQPVPVQQAEAQPQETTPSQQPEAPASLSYDWNTTENDAMKNGNIAVAVNWVRRNPNLRQQATTPKPETVATTPYDYYGRVVAFRGEIAVVQNFPPGSDFSNSIGGQSTSDMVMQTADGTTVEMFCLKACGNIRVGSIVNLYGYPAGVTEVKNRIGGTFTHLILVGNDYDDYGVRN